MVGRAERSLLGRRAGRRRCDPFDPLIRDRDYALRREYAGPDDERDNVVALGDPVLDARRRGQRADRRRRHRDVVQAANNGATSCLFPNGTGNCPALAESDLRPLATSWSPAVPTAAYSTTVTIAAQEASAAPAGFAGLYFVVPLTFSGTLGSWTAALAYAAANFEL